MINLKLKKMNGQARRKLAGSQSAGQVALVVLLVSAVVMTLGLSMSKTAKVETKIESDEESLKKAFNVAESAIEYYQATGETSYSLDERTEGTVAVASLGGGQELSLDNFTPVSGAGYFWLCEHNEDGSINEAVTYTGNELKVCVDAGFGGALRIDYFYKSGLDYQVERRGINLAGSGTVSGFANQTVGADNCVDVSDVLSGTPLLLAVIPLSEGSNLRLKGNVAFPFQGEEIQATGTVEGGVNQKVRVSNRFYVPEFILDGITAEGSVLSN